MIFRCCCKQFKNFNMKAKDVNKPEDIFKQAEAP